MTPAKVIFLCDDALCMAEAVARAYVETSAGRVLSSCNCCQKHLDEVRAVAKENAGGKYRLRESEPCERPGRIGRRAKVAP